jgi:hypothetical protein
LGFPNPPKGNQVRHVLVLISILLLSSPLFGQSERPETIIVPVSTWIIEEIYERNGSIPYSCKTNLIISCE